MAKVINGKTWYWVDTVCVDEIIYDVYEDEYGNHHYEVSDTLF